jgi:RNA recognition motif-containing protein
MNIYIGNLSYNTTDQELSDAFGEFGTVSSVKIITDRETGRPRGFGFVEMADNNEGRQAIENLNGKELGGRSLRVSEARPRN